MNIISTSSDKDELKNEWIQELDNNDRCLWRHKFTNEIINQKPNHIMETQYTEYFSTKHQRRYWTNKISGLVKWETINTLPISKQNDFILNNPNENNSNEESFCWSIILGDLNNVKRLYELNNNVIDARYGYRKSTPLIISIENNKLDIVKYLISLDLNINLQDINGNTGLHQSIINGYLNISVLVIRKGANIYIKNKVRFKFIYNLFNY
jgi:ankyrin repeat protein